MDPLPAGPLVVGMLRDVSNFVGVVPNSDTSYSCVIRTGSWRFRVVELKRRDTRAEEMLSHTFVAERSALQVIRTLVACPTWTHGQFVFKGRGLDDLILELFSLLRSSRSLSTVDVHLEPFYQKHLPTLLCENPFLESLILNPGHTHDREHAEHIALCLSRNSVLKSCTIGVHLHLNFQYWEIVLRPFTTSSKREANVALKELVLLVTSSIALGYHVPWEEAIADLVRCNTTLDKLEIRSYGESILFGGARKLLTAALGANRTLKELSCACNAEGLEELIGVFIPNFAGHQASTHLTTLRLVPPSSSGLEYYMKELSRLLGFQSHLDACGSSFRLLPQFFRNLGGQSFRGSTL